MSKKFIQMTSGWIPVSILVLFAIAFVAGQARARQQIELGASAVPGVEILNASETQRRPDHASGRMVIERMLRASAKFRFSVEPQKFGSGSGDPWTDVPSL